MRAGSAATSAALMARRYVYLSITVSGKSGCNWVRWGSGRVLMWKWRQARPDRAFMGGPATPCYASIRQRILPLGVGCVRLQHLGVLFTELGNSCHSALVTGILKGRAISFAARELAFRSLWCADKGGPTCDCELRAVLTTVQGLASEQGRLLKSHLLERKLISYQ